MKGNLVVAHGGGPTSVINASLAGVVTAAQREKGSGKILAARHGIDGLLKEDFIDLSDMSQDDILRLAETPASAIGSCRYKVKEDDYSSILDVFRKYGIEYFFFNGGNDSMDTCNKIHAITRDVQVIGIPKTIDNDLVETDHCPGFGSAARYYAVSTAELALDIQALNIHVSVLEIMGRNAGWLTASTAIARDIVKSGAPHLIYLPEKPFIEEKFLDDIVAAWKKRKGIVVTVSEGLVYKTGEPLVNPKHASAFDSFGHAIAGNVSQYLADLISSRLGIRARSEKPGILGRVSKLLISDVDRKEAYETGMKAVEYAVAGKSGYMIGLQRVSDVPYRVDETLVPLENVANAERKVPDEFISELGNDVTEKFLEYLRPLIGNSFPDYYQL